MIRLIDIYETYETRGFAVSPEHIQFLYDLLAERPPVSRISHREMPTLEQHTAFVMGRPYRAWFLIEAHARKNGLTFQPVLVGALNVTHQNEIGIFIGRDNQRQGYAAQAITALQLQMQPLPDIPSTRAGKWLANVNPENGPSMALFEKLGAKACQITYVLP